MTAPLIASLDIETTGLLDPAHRIVEVYIGLIRGTEEIWSYEQRIDPGRSIDKEAQAVHHISYSDLLGQPTWDTVAPVVFKILSKADAFLWHNGDYFDGPFLHQELSRVGLHLPPKPSIDTMIGGVWATPDGKKPRLQELCFALGIDYDPALAHAAAYDVHQMQKCFWRAQEFGYYPLENNEVPSVAA